MSKIYDCCMLFNELDMLETRFHILDSVVDFFVVCEATATHSAQPKPLNLLDNWDRFKPWRNKLIYVSAGDLHEAGPNFWDREKYQRSKISEGLVNAKSDDWIVVGDADEIPNPAILAHLRDSDVQAAQLELDFYYYDLNHRVRQGWAIGAYRDWVENDPNKIRMCSGHDPVKIYNAGHHFSYFGGPQQIVEKVGAFMHSADPGIRDIPRTEQYVASRIAAGVDLYDRDLVIERVPISDTLPRYILDNLDKYRALGWVE